jgi:hypothetical protein
MTRRGRKNEDVPRIGKRGAYELFKQTKIDNGFYDIHVQAPPGVCRAFLAQRPTWPISYVSSVLGTLRRFGPMDLC